MAKPTPCPRFEERLSSYLLGDLPVAAAAAVKAHLDGCPACQATVRELEPTLAILRETLTAESAKVTMPSPVLEPARRQAIRDANRRPRPLRFRLLTRFWRNAGTGGEHTRTPRPSGLAFLKAAAIFIVLLGILGLLLPSFQGAREIARLAAPQSGGDGPYRYLPSFKPEPDVKELNERPAAPSASTANGWFDDRTVHEAAGEGYKAPAPKKARDSIAVPADLKEERAGKLSAAESVAATYDAPVLGDESKNRERTAREPITELSPPKPVFSGGAAQVARHSAGKTGARGGAAAGTAGAQDDKAAQAKADHDGERLTRNDSDKFAAAGPDGAASETKAAETETTAGQGSGSTSAPGTISGLYAEGSHSGRQTALAKAPAKEKSVPATGRLFKKSENAPATTPPPPSAPQLALAPAPARVVTAPAKPQPPRAPAPDGAPADINGSNLERQDVAKAIAAEDLAEAAPSAGAARRELEKAQKEGTGKAALKDRVETGTVILLDQMEAVPEDKPTPPVFETHTINPFIGTAENAFSTFSMDVDTASYTMARRAILDGRRPPPESIRVEEFINSFDYDYQPPTGKAFAIHAQSAASAFRPSLEVLEIGIKATRLGRDQQRRAVLTLLIDTSGSMDTPDRLRLVKRSLTLLVGQLKTSDSLAIVQFASKATLVLEPTRASERARILEAIDNLQTAGSTHLEDGMRLAYQTAARAFVSGGSNRVLLLSDGVANLGAGNADSILKAVETYRKQGIYLSVFGFGSGSYNDAMLQNLANKGDGAYVFIDSLDEAKRVLVDDLTATLHVMASDAKIQVEFNPKRVARYRQIGYEKRQLTKEQFRDDSVDAAEIGSGQSVTALYELELQGSAGEPLGVARVRYRDTSTGQIEEIEKTITSLDRTATFAAAPVRYRLAAAVAEFAEVMRGSPYVAGTEVGDVAKVLRPVALELRLDAHIQELLRLVQTAESLPGN